MSKEHENVFWNFILCQKINIIKCKINLNNKNKTKTIKKYPWSINIISQLIEMKLKIIKKNK